MCLSPSFDFLIESRTPLAIQLRCMRARPSRIRLRVGELLVLLARVPAGHLALDQIGVVAAVVHPDQLLGEVELDDAGHGAGEELAVVADDDDARPRAGDETLELLQAVEVEVVGGLVEQEDVVAGQQQPREADPGGLTAGEAGHRDAEVDPGCDPGDDLRGPLLEVGAAEGQPPLQRVPVVVVGAVASRRRAPRSPGRAPPARPPPRCGGRARPAPSPPAAARAPAADSRAWPSAG